MLGTEILKSQISTFANVLKMVNLYGTFEKF